MFYQKLLWHNENILQYNKQVLRVFFFNECQECLFAKCESALLIIGLYLGFSLKRKGCIWAYMLIMIVFFVVVVVVVVVVQ